MVRLFDDERETEEYCGADYALFLAGAETLQVVLPGDIDTDADRDSCAISAGAVGFCIFDRSGEFGGDTGGRALGDFDAGGWWVFGGAFCVERDT